MPEKDLLGYIKGRRIALMSFSCSDHNGISIVMKRQAELLSAEGYDVTVFCFESDTESGEYNIQRLYIPNNNPFRRLYRIFWPIFVAPLLFLSFQLKDFDTIISHKYPFNVACAFTQVSSGCKYIYYDHGVAPPSVYQDVVGKVYSKLMRKLQAVSARPADVVISISQFVADELEEEGGPKATEIIYNETPGVVQQFDPTLRDIRAEHNIPEDGKVILFVGRITRHKNIHCLIEAHTTICKQAGPSPYLVIVGKPTQERYYRRISKRSNENVKFAGYVDKKYLASYYKQADVYATASLWEGCNLTVLEAQEAEIPVVAFDTGAHPETVDAPPGRLVKERDCVALADSICQVLILIRYHGELR